MALGDYQEVGEPGDPQGILLHGTRFVYVGDVAPLLAEAAFMSCGDP